MGDVKLSGYESEYKFTRRVMEMVSRGYTLIDMGFENISVSMDTYNYGKTKIMREGKESKRHWAVLRIVETTN